MASMDLLSGGTLGRDESARWDRYLSIQPGRGLQDLCGFVSQSVEEALAHAGLVVDAPQVHMAGPTRAADVQQLFKTLMDAGIGYRLEEVDAEGAQVVRTLDRVLRQGGTCLDLALLSCNQLRHAQLRPYLVLDYDDVGGAHALVLVNLVEPSTSPYPTFPPGSESEDVAVRWQEPRLVDPDSWLIYDPTDACLGHSRDFATSRVRAMDRISQPGHETWLVDITAGVMDPDIPARDMPAPGTPGLLTRLSPPVPPTIDFASRRPIRDVVESGRGCTVLTGERGSGKSTLALQAIAKATHGAGWFLEGRSKQALQNALAAQEGYERGERSSRTDADLEGYARAALRRLETIRGPWTVVVDNADLSPRVIDEFLPRANANLGQHLIITTTDVTADGKPAGWRDWANRRKANVVALDPLTVEEIRGEINAVAQQDIVEEPSLQMRRPLALRAVLGLIARQDIDAARRVLSANDVEAAHWNEILRILGDDAPTRRLARLIAALPTSPVPLELANVLVPGARDRLDRLDELGLIRQSQLRWSMHGLHAAAIRRDEQHGLDIASDLVRVAQDPRITTHLRRNYDYAAIRHMATVLDDGRHHEDTTGLAIAELAEVVDERGTATDARDLAARALANLPEEGYDLVRGSCLLAWPRWVNQRGTGLNQPTADEIREAITQAERAEMLARNSGEDPTEVSRIGAKSVALQGLLTKKLVRTVPAGKERRALLLEAKSLIDEALAEREVLFAGDEDNPELAKARFNVCGVSIEIAKALADEEPDTAMAALDQAAHRYEQVEETRRRLYESPHRHIASCVAGRATVGFYKSTLFASNEEEARDQLREATERAVSSLHDRAIIEGDVDGQDVQKSLRILSKIVLARIALAIGDRSLWADDGGVLSELRTELGPLLDRLGSSGHQQG